MPSERHHPAPAPDDPEPKAISGVGRNRGYLTGRADFHAFGSRYLRPSTAFHAMATRDHQKPSGRRRKEMAAESGMSVGSLKVAVHRGIAALRKALVKDR